MLQHDELSDGSYQADVYVDGVLSSGGSNWQIGQRNNQTGVRDSDQVIYRCALEPTQWQR